MRYQLKRQNARNSRWEEFPADVIVITIPVDDAKLLAECGDASLGIRIKGEVADLLRKDPRAANHTKQQQAQGLCPGSVNVYWPPVEEPETFPGPPPVNIPSITSEPRCECPMLIDTSLCPACNPAGTGK